MHVTSGGTMPLTDCSRSSLPEPASAFSSSGSESKWSSMARLEAPVTNTSLRAPATIASSTAYWISGLSTIGSISLGLAFVAGRKRVPRAATGKTAALIGCFKGNSRKTASQSGPADDKPNARLPVSSRTRAPAGPAPASGSARLAGRPEQDVVAVDLDRPLADALYQREIVHALEGAVLVPVFDDGPGLGQPDALYLRGDRLRIRTVVVLRPSLGYQLNRE